MSNPIKNLLFIFNSQTPIEVPYIPLPGTVPGAIVYIETLDTYYISSVDEYSDSGDYYWIIITDMEEVPKYIKTYVMLMRG